MEDIYKKEKQEIIHLEKLNLIWDVHELKSALKMGLFSILKIYKNTILLFVNEKWEWTARGCKKLENRWEWDHTSLSFRSCRRHHTGVFWNGGAEHLHPLAALAINLLKEDTTFWGKQQLHCGNNHLDFVALFSTTSKYYSPLKQNQKGRKRYCRLESSFFL